MNEESRIYVAGHRGLVGSALVRKLQQSGYRHILVRTSAELDLRRQQLVEDFFAVERPEYVFLAAARVGGILANDTYKADFISDNLSIGTNVVRAAHRYGVKKFINLGSSCIYPRLATQPIKEEYLLTGPLEPTNEPYAIAKIAAIKLCRYYNEQYGTNFLSVMPTNLYGPNDSFNLETSHVLPALIRKFHLARLLSHGEFELLKADIHRLPVGFGVDEQARENDRTATFETLARLGISSGEVVLWGTGEPFREFLHVDDLADACLYLMERYDYAQVGELVNIGTGVDMTIKDLADLVRKVVGFSGSIRFDSSKPSGTPRKLLDVSKMKSLGWESRIRIEDGVSDTVKWYQAMFDHSRLGGD